MKITIVMPGFVLVPGGSHRVIYEYANHLVARGHEVRIVYPRKLKNLNHPPHTLLSWLKAKITYGLRLLRTPRPSWFLLDKRVKTISINEPVASSIPDGDIVMATLWAVSEYVIEYPKSKGKKFYLLHHYENAAGSYPKERVDNTLTMPFYKIVVSRWTQKQMQQLGVTNLFYIPNGIDHSIYQLIKPIENRPPRVAMGYVPKKIKDPQTGIRALSIVKKKFPEIEAVFFGASSRDRAIPDWIDYCHRQSNQSIVEKVYNSSAIFLCSSIVEGFGLPPAEAMACGCAVVSTDCGGIRDYAEHGVNSLLSAPQEPTILAENMCLLLENQALRIKLAKAGQEKIRDFTWQRSCDMLEQVMKNVVGR